MKYPQEKNSYYSLSIEKNYTVFKFLKQWKRQVTEKGNWESERYILFYIHWKKKVSSNLVGETKKEEKEEEQEEDTINLQEMESQHWKQSNHLEKNLCRGNLAKEKANQYTKIDNRTQEEIAKQIDELKTSLEVIEKYSKLNRKLHKYTKQNPYETWSSRWIAAPTAYLISKEKREEWIGDLNEINEEMVRKEYPRWLINIINVGQTSILVFSALKIKAGDILSVFKQKRS